MHADPAWLELREYYDPLDGSLLEVEAVPPGYPIVHSFEPDLEGFYTSGSAESSRPSGPEPARKYLPSAA